MKSAKELKLKVLTASILSVLSTSLCATGLQPIDTDVGVSIQAIDFNIETRGIYVSGLMEVQFIAASGEENAANLRFPLPTDSVIHKAEIYIPADEKWMIAETTGRREGQIIFDEIVKQKDDPLLIQSIGTDFYRARVFPINAGGDLRMRVHYAHTLESAENGYLLEIPFANKDSTASTPANGVTVSLRTDPDFWQPSAWKMADETATPSTLNSADLQNGTAFLNLQNFEMNQDVSLNLMPKMGMVNSAALSYQSNNQNIANHTHTWWKPDFSDYPAILSRPRNVVFVIDISGSMSGQKLSQTRESVIQSLESLNPEDYFGLVAFESDTYVFAESMRSGADINEAIQWVAGLRSLGGTGMSAGLQKAAEMGLTSPLSGQAIDLFLITDGRPNEGSETVTDLVNDIGTEADRIGRRIRIFTVGIGDDLDQDLLNGIANATNGESTFALDDSEITGQVLDLFERVRGGGVSNATSSITGLENAEFAWNQIFPNTIIQMGAKGSATEFLTLNLNGRADDLSSVILNENFPAPSTGNDGIHLIVPPLVAKTWADRLERQIDKAGETTELVNEAVRLARTYGIVTRYSSLLALETEEMYVEQGVKRIERDPAGIALEPVEDSTVDEGRIGGQGTDDGEMLDSDINFSPMPTNTAWTGASTSPTSIFDSAPASYDSSTSGAPSPAYEPSPIGFEESLNNTAKISCASPELDSQLQLHIPQVTYQGQYYWANLQLKTLNNQYILELLDYGVVDPANVTTCAQEVTLSTNWELYIPQVRYPIGMTEFFDIQLQREGMCCPTCSCPYTPPTNVIRFEVLDFRT